MAKNIEMNILNTDDNYEIVYPKTLSELVIHGDTTVKSALESMQNSIESMQNTINNLNTDYVSIDYLLKEGIISSRMSVMSWSDISAELSNGNISTFSVGDNKIIRLNGTVGTMTFSNTLAYATVIGINHNSSIEGRNRLHLQISLSDNNTELLGAFGCASMNTSNTNSGGWSSSYMRNTICAQFLNCLPSDLRAVIKSTTKYTDNTGGGSDTASYVKATTDNIFLLSEYEVFGVRNCANSAEQNYQAQYDWYKTNTRVKNLNGSARYWWLRSPFARNNTGFCRVDPSGQPDAYSATDSYWFAPCLCV